MAAADSTRAIAAITMITGIRIMAATMETVATAPITSG